MKRLSHSLMKKVFTAIALAVLIVTTVLADQAAWITKEQAEKAAAFLKDKKEIRHYCAPCDDKGDKVEAINTVDTAKIQDENYWEVRVNGQGTDLAYVYFKTKDGKWKNLAKETGVKVKDVPKFLP